MPEVVEHRRYIKSDAGENNNKFWYITRYDNNDCFVEWGRVGKKAQSKTHSHSSESSAINFFNKKCAEKEGDRKGYHRLNVVAQTEKNDDSTTMKVSRSISVEDRALSEMDVDSEATKNLIRYLVKENVHNILNSTTMTYNAVSGLFQTPCGVVTQANIDSARDLLDDMADYIDKDDYESKSFINNLQNYLMLVPQDIGMKFVPRNIIPDMNALKRQSDILDSLEASIKMVLNGDGTDGQKSEALEKIFNTKLHLLEDKKEIERIRRKYKDTKSGAHVSSKLDVESVYCVEIANMKSAFERKSKGMSNIWELWHGTRVGNLLSILKGGLIIPPSRSSHVTGRLYGDGLYFSDQSTKSLNYSYGYWGGGRADNNCFMFVCDVAMGEYYLPNRNNYQRVSYPQKGFQSTFAKAGSGVMNNEMIVYETDQANLKYLVKFSDKR